MPPCAILHDELQEVVGDEVETVDVGGEMLQLVALQIVGKQAVAVGGDPDNVARVVHDVVALLVDVVHLLGRHQAKALDAPRLGIDIPHHTRAVVHPVVAAVIGLYLPLGDR